MNRRFKQLLEAELGNVKPLIKEQTFPTELPIEPTQQETSSDLPDCIEYIKNNARVPESETDNVGSSSMLKNVDIEYFTDGGPNNLGIAIMKNGTRACWTKV